MGGAGLQSPTTEKAISTATSPILNPPHLSPAEFGSLRLKVLGTGKINIHRRMGAEIKLATQNGHVLTW